MVNNGNLIYVETDPETHITYGVSIADVQTVLGVTDTDLGKLCTNSRVKTWAKYKPIEIKDGNNVIVEPITDNQRARKNWGIKNIPTWTSKMLGHMTNFWLGVDMTSTNYPDNYSGGFIEWWAWDKPTSAYRLTDFIKYTELGVVESQGYFKNAAPPIGELKITPVSGQLKKIIVTSKGAIDIEFNKSEDGVYAGLSVKYEDLSIGNFSYNTMYFGISMLRYNDSWEPRTPVSNNIYSVTQRTQMSAFQEQGSVIHCKITDSNFTGGNFKIFPFLSNNAIGGDVEEEGQPTGVRLFSQATNINSSYIALLEPEMVDIEVQYSIGIIESIQANKNASDHSVLYGFTISKISSELDVSRTFDCTIELLGISENVLNSTLEHITLNAQTSSLTYSDSINASGQGWGLNDAKKLKVTVVPQAGTGIIFLKTVEYSTDVE